MNGNALSDILQNPAVWRGNALPRLPQPGLSSGFAKLDAELPGGGWPAGMLTEILPECAGIGELRLVAPALSKLSSQGKYIAWIAPPFEPYAPSLSAAGIDLSRFLIVRAPLAQDALWATEQALRSNACGAVLSWQISWPMRPRFADLRRLQLAAEGGQGLALLFRPAAAAHESSPAPLRLGLAAHAEGLSVNIMKRRGRPAAHPVLLPASSVASRDCHALDCTSSATTTARDLRQLSQLNFSHA